MSKEEKVKLIIERLSKVYKNPKTSLNYSTPLELLIATILSAQATDKLVNNITPLLFAKFTNVYQYADSTVEEIDEIIKKINFHRNKAKNISEATKMIVNKYKGILPETMEELDALPGVARKTANVVLGQAFNKAYGIVVDTHVLRLSTKLGLTENTDPVKIELDLMRVVPKESWIIFPNLLILFGREYCPAKKHNCSDCPLLDLCPDIL